MSGKKTASFKERFTELITSSPKSRTSIAKDIGVAKQTISAWVTGQSSPRLPMVGTLATYFGVSLPWLMGYDVPKFVDNESYNTYREFYLESIKLRDELGFISSEEYLLVKAYRGAEPTYQKVALEILENHQKKTDTATDKMA